MTLIKWQKERPARTLLQAGDLFNEFFNDFNAINTPRWNSPAVNIVEEETSYRIELAAPGYRKEDLNIRIEDDILVCSSDRKQESGQHPVKYSRKEFSFNTFTRKFNLPENVNTTLIKAQYENGVMSIHLPKKTEQKPVAKSISID